MCGRMKRPYDPVLFDQSAELVQKRHGIGEGFDRARVICVRKDKENHTIPPSLIRAENWCRSDTESRRGLRSRTREGFCVRQDEET